MSDNNERDRCPDCGWWTKNWDRDDWFHAPDCPVEKRWEAVRPATCPCCGEPTTDVVDTGPGGTIFTMFGLDQCLGLAAIRRTREDDEAWFADHPDVDELHRPMTVARERVCFR